MTSTSAYDEAKRLLNKMLREERTLAVFLDCGRIRTARPNSPWGSSQIKDRPYSLVGVYNQECELEWLIEDLSYMMAIFERNNGSLSIQEDA